MSSDARGVSPHIAISAPLSSNPDRWHVAAPDRRTLCGRDSLGFVARAPAPPLTDPHLCRKCGARLEARP